MKVIIFKDLDITKIESQINEFIHNADPYIKFTNQSIIPNENINMGVVIVISIFYE